MIKSRYRRELKSYTKVQKNHLIINGAELVAGQRQKTTPIL